ncbi:MAG: hypothetical protein ABSD99_12995 [Candidatus Bathyarchaeia archaeon]
MTTSFHEIDAKIKVLAKWEKEADTLYEAKCERLRDEISKMGAALGVTQEELDAAIKEAKSSVAPGQARALVALEPRRLRE